MTVTTENRVHNRLYKNRQCIEKKGLPPTAAKLLKDKLDALPYKQASVSSSDKDLVTLFQASWAQLQQMNADLQTVLSLVPRANIEVRALDAKAAAAIYQAKAQELEGLVPVLKLPKPNVLTFELMEEPTEVICRRLGHFLAATAQSIVERFTDGLDTMLASHLVGRQEWSQKKDKVCWYTFHRFVVIQEELAKRESITARHDVKRWSNGNDWEETVEIFEQKHTERDLQRTHRNAEHRHELHNAKLYAWNDRAVRQPSWVQGFYRACPAWMRDYLPVVAGDMIRELVVERDVRIENWTEKEDSPEVKVSEYRRSGRLYSPSVLFDNWSLVGWSDRDFREGRS